MGKLVVTTFVTLDGVMQAPGGPTEDPSGGFAYGGWTVPLFDDDTGRFMDEVFRRVEAFLLGRTTYQIFAAHWPRVTDPNDPVASKLNRLPKYVASRTLARAEWSPSTIVRDVVPDVTRLKRDHPGEVQVHGSAGLLQTLVSSDLVDTYHVLTFPVVLGSGKRLFGSGAAPSALRLAATRTTRNGIVISTYERAGKPTFGSFMLEPA